jgi:hypothetical protein
VYCLTKVGVMRPNHNKRQTMYKRLNCISLVIALAHCLGMSDAGAISVPYDHDSHAAEGTVNFPPMPQWSIPFPTGLMGEQHSERVHGHLDKVYPHLWDVHPGFGDGQDAHGDGDVNSEDGGNIPYPPQTGHCRLITPSVSTVPVPAALWLFLSGLIGLGLTGKFRRR